VSDMYEFQVIIKFVFIIKLKSIRENQVDITTHIDELIIVISMQGMLFLYVIWLSLNRCYVLDV
jgi:hypothetical protein